jgi:heterodisulfide reductase subunit A-like polyferredoxin
LDKIFTSHETAMSRLSPTMLEIEFHPRIKLHSYAHVTAHQTLDGGAHRVSIFEKSRHVSIERCTSCNVCTIKCPKKKVPFEFDLGLSNRTAVYFPFQESVPRVPVIDVSSCIYFERGKCRACEMFCEPRAIDFDNDIPDREVEVEASAVVVATGLDMDLSGWRFKCANLYNGMEFERLIATNGPTAGDVVRRSDRRKAARIAISVEDSSVLAGRVVAKQALVARARGCEVTMFGSLPLGDPYVSGLTAAGVRIAELNATDFKENPANKNVIVKHELGEEEFEAAAHTPRLAPKVDEAMARSAGDPSSWESQGIFLAGSARDPMDIGQCALDAAAVASKVFIHARRAGEPLLKPATAFSYYNV